MLFNYGTISAESTGILSTTPYTEKVKFSTFFVLISLTFVERTLYNRCRRKFWNYYNSYLLKLYLQVPIVLPERYVSTDFAYHFDRGIDRRSRRRRIIWNKNFYLVWKEWRRPTFCPAGIVVSFEFGLIDSNCDCRSVHSFNVHLLHLLFGHFEAAIQIHLGWWTMRRGMHYFVRLKSKNELYDFFVYFHR